jgi:hypothetical protein
VSPNTHIPSLLVQVKESGPSLSWYVTVMLPGPSQGPDGGRPDLNRAERDWSGRPDLNRRPLVPQTSALTKLRHVPTEVPNNTLRQDGAWSA